MNKDFLSFLKIQHLCC